MSEQIIFSKAFWPHESITTASLKDHGLELQAGDRIVIDANRILTVYRETEGSHDPR